MTDNPQIPTGASSAPCAAKRVEDARERAYAAGGKGRGFAWRLAAFYAALFGALGVQLPFLPVWLAAKGLDAAAIGIVLAIPMVVRLFAVPLAAGQADRHDALRAALVIAAAGAVLSYGAVALAQGTVAIMA